jgi:small subunit ribosomal protein S16
MMVKLRLTRVGRKHDPSYRIVVTPLREKRDSKAIEYVGTYSPLKKETVVNKERVQYWLSVGAQPSDTVRNILIREKIIDAPAAKSKIKFSKAPGRKKKERAEKEASE